MACAMAWPGSPRRRVPHSPAAGEGRPALSTLTLSRGRADTSGGAIPMVPFFTNKALTAVHPCRRSGLRFFVITSGGGSVQRKNRNRIKLLVTLVLFTLVVTSTWSTSQAAARGAGSPGTSSHSLATRPGAGLACGDPDAGQNVAPPPTPSTKDAVVEIPVGGWRAGSTALKDWARWTSRIWATLMMRAAR